MNTKIFVLLCFLLACKGHLFAQDDMLSLLDNTSEPDQKVSATFKTTKIINAESIETVKAKTMDFRITHRFGNIGAASGGGGHTLYGFDNSEDIRISFDFGITDKLMLGIARSKKSENIDGVLKYRFLEQTTSNKIPLTIAFYGNIALTARVASQLYGGTINTTEKFIHRFSYISQLILARKFNSSLSLELLPTYSHRNFVKSYINPDNGAEEQNDLFALGVGGRIKLTKRFAILADYFYTLSDYRNNNSTLPYYAPLALGIEIETGGHVFHLNFTNASAVIANEFIPNTNDNWLKGGYKFGFNISRVFNL